MATSVIVGVVRRPRGLRGDVVVADLTGGAYAPQPGQEVSLRGPAGERRLVVEKWRAGPNVVAKFAGVDGREAAAALRGYEVEVPPEAMPAPPPDGYYTFQLVGLSVETTAGEKVGEVVAVTAGGAHDNLTVRGPAGEMEIPFVRAHVAAVLPGEKIIIVPYREE